MMNHKISLSTFSFFLLLILSGILPLGCSQSTPEEIDLEMLAYSLDGNVYIDQWPDGIPQKIDKGREPSLSYTGRYVAYSSQIGDKKRIAITDLAQDEKWFIEDIHGAGFRPQWSPTENKLLFSALVLSSNISHRMVVIYNPFSKHKSAIMIRKTDIFSPVWSPDGQTILAHDNTTLYEWDLKGELMHTFPLKEIFGDYHFSPQSTFRPSRDRNQWLFVASETQDTKAGMAIFLFDAVENKTRRVTPSGITPTSFSWGPQQQSVLIAGTSNGTIGNLPQGESLMLFSLEGEPLGSWHPKAENPSFYSLVVNNKK